MTTNYNDTDDRRSITEELKENRERLAETTAEIQVELDEDTHRLMQDAYDREVEHGYGEGFYTFVLNHASWSPIVVTVDGEPVATDPGDGGGFD